MRKTRLRQVSTTVGAALVCGAVFFALVRTFVIRPAVSLSQEGSELFKIKGCVQCHFTDSKKTKIGPGLQGLFNRVELPVSGREATEVNVRTQLKTPYESMPSFDDRLTEKQLNKLIEYLKTL